MKTHDELYAEVLEVLGDVTKGMRDLNQQQSDTEKQIRALFTVTAMLNTQIDKLKPWDSADPPVPFSEDTKENQEKRDEQIAVASATALGIGILVTQLESLGFNKAAYFDKVRRVASGIEESGYSRTAMALEYITEAATDFERKFTVIQGGKK